MRTALARLTAPLLLIGPLIVPATTLVTPAAAAPRHVLAAAPGAYQPLNPRARTAAKSWFIRLAIAITWIDTASLRYEIQLVPDAPICKAGRRGCTVR